MILGVLTFVHTLIALWIFAGTLPIATEPVTRAVLMSLFGLLFSVVAFSFWMAVVGWLRRRFRRDWSDAAWTASPPIHPAVSLKHTQVAILVPVYNESPVDVLAGSSPCDARCSISTIRLGSNSSS